MHAPGSLSGSLSLLWLFECPVEVSAAWWLNISPWQGVPLFDGSCNFIDPQTLQSLQHCQLLLSNLSTVLNCFLTEARELTERGWWKHCWVFGLIVKIWKDAWVVPVERGAVVVLDGWERVRLSWEEKFKSEQLGLWLKTPSSGEQLVVELMGLGMESYTDSAMSWVSSWVAITATECGNAEKCS